MKIGFKRPGFGAVGGGLARDFQLLWAGQTVSNIGDRINLFVVPTVMILLLDASAFEVGLVSMAQYLAIPLLSLVAGMFVDRWDLRRTLIVCDLLRFVMIAVIPAAYFAGVLSVPLLFVTVAVSHAAAVFFNVGYTATIAAIVPADKRVNAYSRLEASRTTSEVVGPSIASGLYLVTGVASLVVDALTFLFSAECIRRMKPHGGGAGRQESMWSRLKHGIRLNWTDPVLRRTLQGTLLANIGGPIFVTVMPLLAYRGLSLSVGTMGVVMSVAAGGAVVGSLVAGRVSKRVGAPRMIPWSIFLHSAVGLGILAAPALPSAAVLAVTLALYGIFMVWYNVNTAAVRQARVPAADQAVSHAAFRTITWGIIPISIFAGGVLVEVLAGTFGDLNASKITMVFGTLIGTFFAAVPLAPLHAMIKREEAGRQADTGQRADGGQEADTEPQGDGEPQADTEPQGDGEPPVDVGQRATADESASTDAELTELAPAGEHRDRSAADTARTP